MKKALTAESLKKGIMQASPLAQTDCLEGFHSVLNLFAPKLIAYSYIGMFCRYFHFTILIFFSYVPFCFFQYVLVICSIIMTKVCFFLFLYRHILAALHFNYNLHRDDKLNEDNSVPVKLSYPKFKNGEATVRSQKVEQNFGKQITFITLYINKPNHLVLWHLMHSVASSLPFFFFSEKVNFHNKIIMIAITQISTNSSLVQVLNLNTLQL